MLWQLREELWDVDKILLSIPSLYTGASVFRWPTLVAGFFSPVPCS